MIEVGIDCEEISRFESFNKKGNSFLRKIYTDNEIDYCLSKTPSSQHFAVRFAAKEAVRKCSTELSKIPLKNIEVVKIANSPEIKINIDKEMPKIKLSLTHSDKTAVAVALALEI